MHRIGISHRDIKPSNLLLKISSNTRPTLKIGDFGLAVHVEQPQLLTEKLVAGTQRCLSPEILEMFQTHENTPYNPFKQDIWASAITYIEFKDAQLAGKLLWHSADMDLEWVLSQLDWITDANQRTLLKKMLDVNPDSRWSSYNVFYNPWFQRLEGQCRWIKHRP